jgi:DNA (cytosine-5)-methyltransferase 1
MITVGSLFAGIGGIDLGLERTGGFKTVWQVEIDPYATRVLEKHWPDVRRWDDVRTFPPEPTDGWRCDLICGGFPCTEVSIANTSKTGGLGLDGEHSGLWREFKRVLGVLRPRYALIENSKLLVVRGLQQILCDVAELGYDAEWSVVSACSMGAPHTRERLFIILHSNGDGLERRNGQDHREVQPCNVSPSTQTGHWMDIPRPRGYGSRNGVPNLVHRLRCLGNAVVPQVAEFVGRRILELENIKCS